MRGTAVARLLELLVRIPPGACMLFVSVVCCQGKVFASGLSLLQRTPTDCCVSEYYLEASIMKRTWSNKGWYALCGDKKYG